MPFLLFQCIITNMENVAVVNAANSDLELSFLSRSKKIGISFEALNNTIKQVLACRAMNDR